IQLLQLFAVGGCVFVAKSVHVSFFPYVSRGFRLGNRSRHILGRVSLRSVHYCGSGGLNFVCRLKLSFVFFCHKECDSEGTLAHLSRGCTSIWFNILFASK